MDILKSELEPHQLTAKAINDKSLLSEMLLMLSKQIRDKDKHWDGCFGAKPTSNIAWNGGWDPNSRVLVSLLLSIGLANDAWPKDAKDLIAESARYAIQSEIRLNRIPITYTNVAISLAASCFYLGRYFDDEEMFKYGRNLIEIITNDRLTRGGFHEFGSPTYLGLSLLAASFAEQINHEKIKLVDLLSSDLDYSWDSKLCDFVGPSMRSYGPSVHSHYSLSLLAINPFKTLKSYNPKNHLSDQSFKDIFTMISPFDQGRVYKNESTNTKISGVATLTLNSVLEPVRLGGANFTQGAWHHQAVSASIHSDRGALILRHPSISTKVSECTIQWQKVDTNQNGFPKWLWGSLPLPTNKDKLRIGNINTQGWNISLLDPTHIKVGSAILLSSSPVFVSGDSFNLNANEGSLTLI